MPGAASGRFIEAPRSHQQQLREAERAIEEERFSDAVVRLGDLLAIENENLDELDLAGQDFFLEINDSRGAGVPVTRGLFRTAREMIANLPDSALETYELRYGPLARRLLNEAAGGRDWSKARDVRRKYFHTKAGFEASFLLAQNAMYGGHALSASLLLDDVVKSTRAVQHLGSGVVVLHASAMKLAGRDVSSVDSPRAGEVEVGGASTPWPEPGELDSWLEQRVGRLDGFARGESWDYPIFGSRPDRNNADSGQMPLSNLRWMLDTTASPRQERTVRKAAEELLTSGKLPPPSWIPLRVGDQLLMRTTERLVGVDYRTGKRVWIYPWEGTYELFDEEEAALDALGGRSEQADLLTQRVWNDVPYGQISSDGERVYLLDDLREVEMARFSPMINLRGTRPADTGSNTLVALELETEGKLLWRIGTGSDDDTSLSNAFFLGPPLPLDGRLYVMAEIAGDINLCCLDPDTGKELWRQQLVAVESTGIDGDPIRRVAGAMPTYHEGVLICPTGVGAIVALDLSDRMLRWGVNYERNAEMIRSVSGRGRGLEASQLMQRWFSGAAVAQGGAVLVTPIEADRLMGLELLTGKSLFPQKNRVHMRYLAGIRGDRFFTVGANQVRAFDLNNGVSVWTTPRDMLASGELISGYGLFGDGEYLVPTTSDQIVRISLEDGTVIERRTTRYPLGNLIAVDGEIITQSPTSLAVAFGESTLEPIVNRMLERDPDDFEALVRKSELLIQREKRDEALDLLARARDMQPDNDEVRMLSVSAMLGKLRDSGSLDDALIQTLDHLIDRPAQRVELLSLNIRSAMQEKQYEAAARRLIDLSSLIVTEPLLESSADDVLNDAGRQCSLDSWLAARVADVASMASESELEVINELLRNENASRAQGSTNLLKRIVRHFGALQGVDPLRRELAFRLQADEAYLDLERLALGSQIPSPDVLDQLPPNRLMMLAEAYAYGAMHHDAIRVLDVLDAKGDAEQVTRSGELRKVATSRITSHQWPDTVALDWESRDARIRTTTTTHRVSETQVLAGNQFEGWRLVSDSTSPLAMRDPTGLLRRIPMEGTRIDDMDKEAQICGGVMVVVMPNGLIGIDMYHLLRGDGESILWRRGLSGDGGPVAKRRSTMTPFDDQVVRYYISSSTASNVIPEFKLGPVMGDRVLLLQGGDLLAIDLFTAETLWRNSAAPKSGAVLCDGERVAVVSPATGELVFFDLLDGRKLESKKWEHGEVWESAGTNVLCYSDTDEKRKYELKLVNAFNGDVILRRETFSANRSNTEAKLPSAYGRVIEARYLALMNNEGGAAVWDLMQGREIGAPEVPVYANLQGLQTTLLDGKIVLMPKRRIERPRTPQTQQLQTTDGSFHRTVHGVHAVSLENGEVQWGHQFKKPWGCTLTQPSETPILVLTRSPFSYSTTSRRKTLDVLALDVRDGKELKRFEGKEIRSTNNELETRLTVQPAVSRVIAQVGTELLTYRFGETDDEVEEGAEAEEKKDPVP